MNWDHSDSEEESTVPDDEERVSFLRKLVNKMESEADHRIHKQFNLLYGITSGLGVLLIVLMLTWILHYRNGFSVTVANQEFYWHPMLMVLGLIFLYAQSILTYRIARHAKKKVLKLTHALLHCLAFILSVLSLKAVFDSHNYSEPPIPNLYSLHSGFLTFLFPGLSKNLRACYLPFHTYFGATIFTMVIVTAMLGLAEKAIWAVPNYSSMGGEAVLVNFIGVILLSFGLLVLYLVYNPTYKRVALAEDDITLVGRVEN
ncbi:hypothetical protein RI129_013234 [Pyrocoelia pectoralis]|uniref:Cytochrome b561 domain-containing protein n=1 Tax=Pyrocoelia pectoralis TaxID=417401 RepID=A0AAN7UVX9_9COLE